MLRSQSTKAVVLLTINNIVGSIFCTDEQTSHIVKKSQLIPALVEYGLQSKNKPNLYQVMWIMDNIARDQGHGRDLIVRSGGLEMVIRVSVIVTTIVM
jgi:hypothetical protein